MHISQKLFKINDEQIILSGSQQEIFDVIVHNVAPRVQIIAPTQYGKSLSVALACIVRAIVQGEKIAIIAPSQDKAQIIMGHVIEHIFDNPLFLAQLEYDSSLEKLKQERSKRRLTFKTGGEIFTLSADARNRTATTKALMGFGAPTVILDEAAHIPDDLFSTAMRMVGGYKDNFVLKIGNPFERNHFYRSWNSNKYYKIFIDADRALKEGRYTQDFVDEMRDEAFFSILYECKFPDADDIDERGYRTLMTPEEIKERMGKVDAKGEKVLGVDIGGGGDFNVYCIRTDNYAWIKGFNRSSDTMTNISEVERIMKEEDIDMKNIFVDDTGIGRGVTDRLKEKGIKVNAVTVGEQAQDSDRYFNLKAELFWEARKWVRQNHIQDDDKFLQLANIKYKTASDRKLKIEPKEDLRRRGIKSPDFADAFMLTFAQRTKGAGLFL